MGGFTSVNYTTNSGATVRLKVSSEMSALVGQNQTTPTSPGNAKCSKTTKEIGIRPRYALYGKQYTIGDVAFTKYIRVWRTTEAHLQASPGTVQWKGQQYLLVRLVAEDDN